MSIEIRSGEVHALLGENGAGKSTLVSILAGALRPNSGSIAVGGKPMKFRSPQDAQDVGISLVHQHFTLIPAFTVEENLALAASASGPFLLNPTRLAAPALNLAERLGWTLNPNAIVSTLGVGQQQRIEVLRALVAGGRVILFDEPTASLTPAEANQLFDLITVLKSEGRAIVLITHKLKEVRACADRVSVLRRGSLALVDQHLDDVSDDELARAMVGDFDFSASTSHSAASEGELRITSLNVESDVGAKAVRDVSFAIRFGEVVGIAGVDGNGQVELAEAIAGIRPYQSGSVDVVPESHSLRIAYIPQDRLRDGLATQLSIADNLMIEGHKHLNLRRLGLILPGLAKRWREKLVSRFEIAMSDERLPAGSLSGGNQQKLVLARLLEDRPDCIIAVDPTRGLDVRAARFVRNRLTECARLGSCVLLFSSDLDELQDVADRLAVMSEGKLLEGGDVARMMGGLT